MKFLRPAFQVLQHYYGNPSANLKLLVSESLDRQRIKESEEVTRTVFGVLRNEIAIDRIIARFARRKPPDRSARLCLKIGAFLLLYSDSYPSYAVVSEVVELAPLRFRPLVNAILRRLAEQASLLRRELAASEDPALGHSMPPLLVDHLRRIAPDLGEAIAYLDREPVFHLQPNPRRLTPAQARALLRRKEIPFRELHALGCLEVKKTAGTLQKLVRLGFFYVQNSASQLVAIIAARFASRRVFDGAAAPGGKSIALSFMRPELAIFASDPRLSRLRLMRENLNRLGISRGLHLFLADLRHYPVRVVPGDLLLLDLPCTSAGTLRRSPDLKSKLDETVITRAVDRQRRILESLLPLPPGSLLLYSVCSFIHGEGEGLLSELGGPLNLAPVDLAPLLDEFSFPYRKEEWGYYLLPSEWNNDLFFISLLQTKG